MLKKLLLFSLALLCIAAKPDSTVNTIKQLLQKPAVKKQPKHAPYVLQYDTIKPAQRTFNGQALEQYRTKPEFDYSETKAKLSWWDRFWAWVWAIITWIFSGHSGPSGAPNPALMYIIAGAGVIGLVFLIIKLLGADLSNIFKRKSKTVEIPYSESLENIHEISFDDELERAIAQRNYKLAVRLLYLRSLKQLSDAGLIHWQIEKTNSAYLNELKDAGKRQSFGVLTRQFEYVWYGDFPVDAPSFQNISTLFQDFKQQLA